MREKSILLIVFIVLFPCLAFSQKENNQWVFGWGSGLDFNSGSPVAITTEIESDDCNATLCDANGDILFYTNGEAVWNRDGDVMPNGSGLLPVGNVTFSSQGALIVPVLDNKDQFYVFSMSGLDLMFSDFEFGRLYYSIVDMSLENGKGDVVDTLKSIPLDSSLANKMIAVPGIDCNIWLLVHDRDTNRFKAYEITAAGISTTPVVSETGHLLTDPLDPVALGTFNLNHITGTMKISPDYTKLAFCSANQLMPMDKTTGLELYDFDRITGIVSNAVLLDSLNVIYGAAFSSDNSKLYVSCTDPVAQENSIRQYDLSNNADLTILDSRSYAAVYTPISGFVDMKSGPDGKIYINASKQDSMHVIEAPNVAGTACSLLVNEVHLQMKYGQQPANFSNTGLPNTYVLPDQDSFFTSRDTTIEYAATLTLEAPDLTGYFGHEWSDGTTGASLSVTTEGTYWVRYGNYCSYHVDTITVTINEEEQEDPDAVATISDRPSGISVWPNPARTHVYVALAGQAEMAGMLTVVDGVGRTVREEVYTGQQIQLYVGDLAPGIYTLLYHNDRAEGLRYRSKIVIAR